MFRASVRANVDDPGLPKFDPPPPKLTPRTPGAAGSKAGTEAGTAAVRGDAGFALAPKVAGRMVQPGDPRAVAPPPRPAPHRNAAAGDGAGDGAIVDYLFDSLEGKGFTIHGIEFSHHRARLVVARGAALEGDGERAAAEIVFNAAPMPLRQVEIVQVARDGGRSRAVVRREDLRRQAKIDRMFDGLEASGFRVEALELSRREARVYLSAAGAGDRADDRAAARLVAAHAPMAVSSVEVVRLAAGVEVARVRLRRGPRGGLTAGLEAAGDGGDGGESSAGLTDNEKSELALRIFADLEAAHFTVDKFEISRGKATVYLTRRNSANRPAMWAGPAG